jgi:hypothetical protein
MSAAVEFLADELKKLVGWGAHPKRLPLLPVLRSLVEVDEAASLIAVGYIIRRHLISQIDAITEAQEFHGKTIKPENLRRALRLLLSIEGTGLSVVQRRYRAIRSLGMYFTVEQWRRPYGPERDLMLLLAESMMAGSESIESR